METLVSQNEFLEEEQDTSKSINIQVLIRIRPITRHETGKEIGVFSQNDNEITVSDSFNKHQVTTQFDGVFNESTGQDQVFQRFESSLDRAIQGFNLTIFAYGQTGSGKTYTMFGKDLETENISSTYRFIPKRPEQKTNIYFDDNTLGLIPRVIQSLFNKVAPNIQSFTIYVSFLQIYNEKIFDLLSTTTKPLSIHENKTNGIFVDGLSEFKSKFIIFTPNIFKSQ